MLILPGPLVMVMGACAPMCSPRLFEPVTLLVVGAILAPGKRPVTSGLRVMGRSRAPSSQHDRRVLHRALWSTPPGGLLWPRWLARAFVPSGPVVIGADDTSERRRGEKMAAKGLGRDPGRSAPTHVAKASGVRWVRLLRLAPIPRTRRLWALPCLPVRAPSARCSQPRGRHPRTGLDRARPAVWPVRHRRPEGALVRVGDSPDAALEGLDAVRAAVCGITRLRRAAALSDAAPPRKPRQNGRPRQQGRRRPTLGQLSTEASTRWRTVTVPHGHGASARRVQITSDAAVWDHSGEPVAPIRGGVVRGPEGRFAPQAWLATNRRLPAVHILTSCVRRGPMEVTFEEARAPRGGEPRRQWTHQALARTTPAVSALSARVSGTAAQRSGPAVMPVRTAAWSGQQAATVSDTIALVRRWFLMPEPRLLTSRARAASA